MPPAARQAAAPASNPADAWYYSTQGWPTDQYIATFGGLPWQASNVFNQAGFAPKLAAGATARPLNSEPVRQALTLDEFGNPVKNPATYNPNNPYNYLLPGYELGQNGARANPQAVPGPVAPVVAPRTVAPRTVAPRTVAPQTVAARRK